MDSGNRRRTFLGMSLAAAGAGFALGDSVAAAEQPASAGPPLVETVYVVIYRPGERWLAGQPLKAQPLRDHFRYMVSLYREGKLRLAGPFGDDSGGAAVFAAADDAEAAAIVAADPAVKEYIFAYDLRRWSWVDWARVAGRAARP